MPAQNYLVVQNNVVTNVVVWDGNTNTWQPPADAVMLPEATTKALVWEIPLGGSEYVLVPREGEGAIGYTWDGTMLKTDEINPPPLPQGK